MSAVLDRELVLAASGLLLAGDAPPGVSLELRAGEVVALLGGSGPALLRVLAGVDSPLQGRLRLAGPTALLTAAPAWERRLSVAESVARALPSERRAREAGRVATLLDAVGLAGRERERADALAPADARRAALARALVSRPALLLADEPGDGLDREAACELHRLLCRSAGELGHGVVLATRDRGSRPTPIGSSRSARPGRCSGLPGAGEQEREGGAGERHRRRRP